MNNLWDTTTPVFDYPDNFKKVYETFYVSQRKNFSNWIGKISKNFANDLDWWSSSVSSRNTYISELFHNICILETLRHLNKRKKFPDKVIVKSDKLKKIVNFYFSKKVIEVRKEKKKEVTELHMIYTIN